MALNVSDKAMSRLRWLLLPGLAAVIVTGVEWHGDRPSEPVANAASWPKAGYGPADFAHEQQRTADLLTLGREKVAQHPDEWLRQESLARALINRSRLSATYDELAEAKSVLATARREAPAGSGPLATDAVLSMMTHRLNDTEAALLTMRQMAVLEPADRSEIESLQGDVDFYRGNFSSARQHYAMARQVDPASDSSYRLAIVAKASGDFDGAMALFAASEPHAGRSTPYLHANYALLFGGVEMARGNYRVAREWFAKANQTFPGYWLFEAHLAQAKALDGDLPGAIADMRQIAIKSPSAEAMDGLAMLLRVNGEAAESRQWAARAGAIWQHRLEQLPEAAYGHALEHELVFGSPQRALELARLNLASRPYGESQIYLASALLLNGKNDEALAQLAAAEKSGWRSAPLYALKAQAFEFSGRQAEAEQARTAARALNPRIFDAITPLVWFSHG